ncbi:MAG: hypothetical protein EX341_16725 [Candidatus Scalindua sp. SCAELEC01]|nr:hypothetical protein [Planctomycetota bacterium]RZV68041.1 MAG: hypothetical protein EX341_16725 [Candidatus Scalindua sp. SCAELEC01]
MKTAMLLDIGVSALQLSGLVYLSYLTSLTIARSFLVIGFSCCAVSMFWLFFNRRSFSINIQDVVVSLKKNLMTGKWILASGILWSLSLYSYPWILVSFHGTESAGVLAACHGTVAIFNPLLTGFQNYISPKIAHSYAEFGKETLYKFVLKITLLLGLVVLVFSLFLTLTGNFLVVKLYGSKYAGNGMVISLLAFDLFLTSIGFSISRTLFVIEKANIDFIINVVSAVFLFSFGIWLIKDFGVFGTAMALIAGNFISIVLLFVYFNRTRRTQ